MGTDNEPEFDLAKLAALPDDEIDTSDISELKALRRPRIGRFSEIESRGYDVRAIANWCLIRARRVEIKVSNLWLNKLVSLIYESSLINRRVLLTPARMEAWEFGPVFREIYFNFPKENQSLLSKFNVVKRQKEIADDSFHSEDIAAFEEVWQKFGHLSGSRLTTITHASGTSWSKVWLRGGAVNPGMVIDVETILGHTADQSNGNT